MPLRTPQRYPEQSQQQQWEFYFLQDAWLPDSRSGDRQVKGQEELRHQRHPLCKTQEPEGQISASTRGALSKSDIHKVSIGLEKAFKISSSKFYPAQSPRTCVRSHARSWRPMVELEHGNGSIRIEDKRTWIDYLKTGKIIKAPQSKLAQFR